MRYVSTGAQVRSREAAVIDGLGLPGIVLMETASRAVAMAVQRQSPKGPVVVAQATTEATGMVPPVGCMAGVATSPWFRWRLLRPVMRASCGRSATGWAFASDETLATRR